MPKPRTSVVTNAFTGSFSNQASDPSIATAKNSLGMILKDFLDIKIPGVKDKHLQFLYEAKSKDL